MSTRRARIKAVAALPPRRKNAENADTNKNKGNPSNDSVEKVLKSPKTPRTHSAKIDDKSSPAVGTTTRTPPGLLPISKTLTVAKTSSPVNVRTPIRSAKANTPTSGKISVITSASKLVNTHSFTSPLVKGSPETRANVFASKSPRNTVSKKLDSSTIENLTILQSSREHDGQTSCKNSNVFVRSTPTHSEKKNDIPEDYNVPSVPESITDDPMDGIVPLQSARSAPNPIDLLKNEIISENAEVLFDPIVPLPSPSKVRPKLRPVPRLAPYRRNSIQGSASESEDESRRALLGGTQTPTPARQRNDSHASYSTQLSAPNKEANRLRNDSVCSTVSQVTVQPPPATSPVKEKHNSKARRQEMSKRMWRRRRETVQRDALTMYDLIFYNPTTNPLVPDQDEMQAKEANAKEEAQRNAKPEESEEEVDDPPAADAAPVPQIKLGPNGEIILDEKSLVIKQSDANRKVSSVVREGTWAGSGGGRYTRAARTADWSEAETVRFYRALAAIGTDFTLMAPLFPKRTRRDLKLKFKKEERLNGAQVDKALRSATSWDAARLQTEFKEEREEAARRAEEETERLLAEKKAEKQRLKVVREMRMRQSRGSKAVESASHLTNSGTADDFIRRSIENKHNMNDKRKKKAIMQTGNTDKQPPNILETLRHPQLATITLTSKVAETDENKAVNDMATLSRLAPKPLPVLSLNDISVPSNIETGSLVVLRVNDPSSPSKTMLQTYIARGDGNLTPVALPSMLLNSVVGYMKIGSPSTMSTASSPLLTSPGSVASQDSRPCSTPSVIQLNPSSSTRQRYNSYTVTPL